MAAVHYGIKPLFINLGLYHAHCFCGINDQEQDHPGKHYCEGICCGDNYVCFPVHIPASNSHIPAAIYNDILSYSFEFYAPQDVQIVSNQAALAAFLSKSPCYLYTTKKDADSLLNAGLRASIIVEAPYYRITKLKLPFLNAKTRSGTLQTRTLLYKP
jgi:hypothetical protein